MAMTFGSLQSQILDYVQRQDTDTANALPGIIYTVTNEINRLCKNIGFEQYVVGNFTVGNPTIQKPARWRRTIAFNYGTGTNNNTRNIIVLRSYEFLTNFWPNRILTAPPQYYADYGFTNYLISPTPDLAYPFELAYIEMPVPLSNTQQTNWLTNYAPDMLLHGCLVETMRYLKDTEDKRLPEWKEIYNQAIQALQGEDDARVYDRQSDRRSD